MFPGSKLHPKDQSKPIYMLEIGEPVYRLTVAPNRITKTGQDQANLLPWDERAGHISRLARSRGRPVCGQNMRQLITWLFKETILPSILDPRTSMGLQVHQLCYFLTRPSCQRQLIGGAWVCFILMQLISINVNRLLAVHVNWIWILWIKIIYKYRVLSLNG